MKNKVLRKLMIMGLTCSMTLTMAPVPVIAAAGEPQTQAASGERQSESGKSGEGETKQADTQKTAEKETTKDTEKEKPKDTDKQTEPQEETKSTNTQTEPPKNASDKTAKAADVKVGGFTLKSEEDLIEDTDYTYDDAAKTLSIKTSKKITIDGNSMETSTKLEVSEVDADITLVDVKIKAANGPALLVNGKKLALTLTGYNDMATEVSNTAAVRISNDSELSITGIGCIEFYGNGRGKDIYLGDASGKLSIADGTVVAKAGIALSGGSKDVKAEISITGGSVNLGDITPEDKVDIKGKGGQKVYKTALTLTKADAQITDLEVKSKGSAFEYGKTGIFTDSAKKIYLFLPEGKAEVKADKSTYAGEVKASGENSLVKAEAALKVTDSSFDAVTYGYERPAAKAIAITNSAEVEAQIEEVTLGGNNKDSFELISGDKTVPANGKNESYKIQPKEGLAAGTYTAVIQVKYNGGTTEATVSFTVNKAKLTPSVTVEQKVYDGTDKGEGSVTLNGAAKDEKPTATATFTYNSENVKDAEQVTIKLVLDEKFAGNYELTENEIVKSATIEKAPNEKEKTKPKKPSLQCVKVNGELKLQLTTYKGQEYIFFGSKDKAKKTLSKTEINKEWNYGSSATKKDRIPGISNLTAGYTYTVWTRYAGDDNHYPGETRVYSSVKAPAEGKTVTSTDNKITGLVEGTTYKNGSTLSFKAIGAGMDNTSPNEGDERYLPTSWKVTEEHSFVSGKYEASFTINTTGSHTLQVTFKKQKYEGSSWVDVNMTSYKKVSFKTATSGVNGTGSGTNGSGTNGSGTNGSGSGKNNTAAKTADNAPILPLGVVFAGSGLLLAGYTLKRRRRA